MLLELVIVPSLIKRSSGVGKVKYVGLSEVGPSLIRKAHAIHPLTCVEQEWSLWSRDIETGIVPTCKELGIGILAYSPLGRGFLTGTVTAESLKELAPSDFRTFGCPRMQACPVCVAQQVHTFMKPRLGTPCFADEYRQRMSAHASV